MSKEPRKPENGPGFERDLETLQARWDRMERAEPPDLLDQAVLNRARRDLETGRKGRPLRWLGGFATATVVVLALAVVLEQEPQVTAPAIEPASEQLNEELAAPPARSKLSKDRSSRQALPPAEPEPMKREARRERQDLQPALGREEKASPDAALRMERKNSEPGVSQESTESLADSPKEQDVLAEPYRAATAEVAEAEEAPLSPETWIERLLALKNEGRQAELAAGIEAFRRAYPDHPLPEELADDAP